MEVRLLQQTTHARRNAQYPERGSAPHHYSLIVSFVRGNQSSYTSLRTPSHAMPQTTFYLSTPELKQHNALRCRQMFHHRSGLPALAKAPLLTALPELAPVTGRLPAPVVATEEDTRAMVAGVNPPLRTASMSKMPGRIMPGFSGRRRTAATSLARAYSDDAAAARGDRCRAPAATLELLPSPTPLSRREEAPSPAYAALTGIGCGCGWAYILRASPTRPSRPVAAVDAEEDVPCWPRRNGTAWRSRTLGMFTPAPTPAPTLPPQQMPMPRHAASTYGRVKWSMRSKPHKQHSRPHTGSPAGLWLVTGPRADSGADATDDAAVLTEAPVGGRDGPFVGSVAKRGTRGGSTPSLTIPAAIPARILSRNESPAASDTLTVSGTARRTAEMPVAPLRLGCSGGRLPALTARDDAG